MNVPSGKNPVRILLVDDDPIMLKAQKTELEQLGYRVSVADSAREALAQSRRQPPDLVLSDVVMPVTDGFQLCRELRRDPVTRDVPVVLISGHYGTREDLRHAARCGANMFVQRSARAGGVAKAIRGALERPQIRLDPADVDDLDVEHAGRVQDRLHVTAEQFGAIYDGIADGVLVTDQDLKVCHANQAVTRLFGYTQKELLGRPLVSIASPKTCQALGAAIDASGWHGEYTADIQLCCKDESLRDVRITGRRVGSGRYVNILHDITEQLRHQKKLQKLADQDPLTGLANRSAFVQRVDEAASRAVKSGGGAGVLVLSVANFREINNTLGPDGGDQVLRGVVQRISLDAGAFTARIGAAQFGVLLPNADTARLVRTAHALLDRYSTPLTVDGIPIDICASVGSSHCPSDAIIGNELIRHACVALHHARKRGLPHVGYASQLDPFSLQRLTLVSELRQALQGKQLEMWYQPKLNLATGRVDAVEALMRWRHPVRGLVLPDDFIPAAESTGLIRELTVWALEAAARQARAWRDNGLDINVAINVSPCDLRETAFVTRALAAVKAGGLAPENVTLEVTESAAMHDIEQTTWVLGELRRHGFRISLDDFGTGYASLGHLRELPVDEIKLDKSFVLDLSNQHSQSIVRGALMVAREFGLKSVAEGVETADNLEFLNGLGCDRAQGHHMSKPLPAGELETWIRRYVGPNMKPGGESP